MPIHLPFMVAVGTRRNIRPYSLFLNGLHQGIAAIPFVRCDKLGGYAGNQCLSLGDIGNLPTGQKEADRISAARPPLSVGFPGNRVAIFSHWLSLSMRRSILPPKFMDHCNSHATTVNTP